jgi:signal transduction histidine kinase
VSDRWSWSELHLKLIERVGPPSLIVNAEHDILHLSEGAAPFLQFAGGEPSTNLLRVVHPGLRAELRAALFRARQSGEIAAAYGIPIELNGERRVVDMQVAAATEVGADLLLVTISAQSPRSDEPEAPRDHDEPVVRHLERELEQTKRYLRDTVEQHEASTEELKASNEELQAMNEELRSATEELETSREELQSINEELTTVNQELKSKVDELAHTNSDLHNLMGATAIATVFLDRELRIMRFTPPAVDLFSIIPTDVGRPLADLHHKLDYPELLSDAGRVLLQLVPIEREISESAGRFFLARMLPYRTTEDRIAGVVLTFVDITERQVAKELAARAALELEQRVQQRTAELDRANLALRQEVKKHLEVEQARQELQRLLISAQEEERGRISRELHDEVGQQISALMLALKALEREAGGELTERMRSMRSACEQVGQEVHQIAFQLRPPALDELGLAKTLTSFSDGWRDGTGTPVELVLAGVDEPRLPNAIETTIYRVIQEAMNNVHKHAHATNVSVSVARRGDSLVAIVEDDGRGFDVSELEQLPLESAKIGIVGMRERAQLVNGELVVESSPGSGTTVRLKLRVPPASEPH